MHTLTGVVPPPTFSAAAGTYEAQVREGQTAQAADPRDLVVLQVENGEAAASLQACDLTEAVV